MEIKTLPCRARRRRGHHRQERRRQEYLVEAPQ